MNQHTSVLLREVIESMSVPDSWETTLIDATVGLGWHAEALLQTYPSVRLIGIDRDSRNLELSRERLEKFSDRCELIHGSFSEIESICRSRSITPCGIYWDLGVSSPHFDESDRGFSFRSDGPLDMRFDTSTWMTASDLVMNTGERELFHLMRDYGDESKALFIARGICEARKQARINSTKQLYEIIRSASYDPKSPVRVFQALRIAVNDEYAHIERSIRGALDIGKKDCVLSVITFHSGEDRLVKNLFRELSVPPKHAVTGQDLYPPRLQVITKKAIVPSAQEIESNPRSRSAQLRIAHIL